VSPEWPREPSPSCEPIVGDVSTRQSALPAWTERRPLGGTLGQFPAPDGTSDDLPTYESLQRQLCAAPELSFVLDSLDPAVAAYAKLDVTERRWELQPALQPVENLLRQCSAAETCRHAIALADSRYEQVKAAIGAKLLLACDAKAAGNRFAVVHAKPLLELEWRVAGPGRATSNAANVKPLLEQVLSSMEGPDMEHAISLLAASKRDDIAALLVETHARLARAPASRQSMARGAPVETPFGADELALELRTGSHPRLQKIYREACGRLGPAKRDDWFVKYRCEAAKPGAKPARVEPRFLRPPRTPDDADVASLPRLLEDAERKRCASAFGGTCPELPAVELGNQSGSAWASLYRAAFALLRAPGSPLAGALLDTPLRRRQGKLEGTWRLWLDGQVYEMGPDAITRASLAWAHTQKSPPSSDALAIRGLLAWLNGIASARNLHQRFFFGKVRTHGFVVMASAEQACTLTAQGLVTFSQEPMMRGRRD